MMAFRIYYYVVTLAMPGLIICDSIIKKPSPQAVKEGQPAMFECSTDKSDNEVLTWYKMFPEGLTEMIFTTINPDYDTTKYEMIIDENGVEKFYNLKIRAAIWEDGTLYKCALFMSNTEAVTSLVVFLEPVISFETPMIEGEDYNITCTAEYGSPSSADMDSSTLPSLSTTVAGSPSEEVFEHIPGVPTKELSLLRQTTLYQADRANDGKNVTCEISTTTPDSKTGSFKILDIEFTPAPDDPKTPVQELTISTSFVNGENEGDISVDCQQRYLVEMREHSEELLTSLKGHIGQTFCQELANDPPHVLLGDVNLYAFQHEGYVRITLDITSTAYDTVGNLKSCAKAVSEFVQDYRNWNDLPVVGIPGCPPLHFQNGGFLEDSIMWKDP